MKKITRKITIVVISIVMLFAITAFSGCNQRWYAIEHSDYEYIPEMLIMNAGETLTIDYTNNRFRGIDVLEIRNLTLRSSNENVLEINGNTVTAAHSGFTYLVADFQTRAVNNRTGEMFESTRTRRIADIHVINEDTMTHITTAEELAAMNDNLDGHFVLMNDIDLADFGEWVPIGQGWQGGAFRGIFANPHGYTIYNLTITTSGRSGGFGLFGSVQGRTALISGVILEDVNLDTSDYEGDSIGSPTVGSIAGLLLWDATIADVFVIGTIVGGGNDTGGIVGSNDRGFIRNSTFKGYIKATREFSVHGTNVGGIAGFNWARDFPGFNLYRDVLPNILNCRVYATLDGGEWARVGGIVGLGHGGTEYSIINASFTGALRGRQVGTKVGSLGGSSISADFN